MHPLALWYIFRLADHDTRVGSEVLVVVVTPVPATDGPTGGSENRRWHVTTAVMCHPPTHPT